MSVVIVLEVATALAFVLGAVNVYLRDIQYLVEICLMWGMWTAPIVYHWSQVSPHFVGSRAWLSHVYLANPITESVMGFQRCFWSAGTAADTTPHLAKDMGITIVVGFVLLWLGQRVFARLQSNFAQEL